MGWVSSSSTLVVVRVVLFPLSLLSYIYIYISLFGYSIMLNNAYLQKLACLFCFNNKKSQKLLRFFSFFLVLLCGGGVIVRVVMEREREIVSE